jgi:hypothetical protein
MYYLLTYSLTHSLTHSLTQVADRDPLPNQPREINCSLETSSWKITIFQSSSDTFDPSLVLASQIVYINDPESRCNLTLSTDNIEDLDAFVEEGAHSLT